MTPVAIVDLWVVKCDSCRTLLRDDRGHAHLFALHEQAATACRAAGWAVSQGADGLGFPVVEHMCPTCAPSVAELEALAARTSSAIDADWARRVAEADKRIAEFIRTTTA